MINNKKKLVGYVTNSNFNEKIIPIPFQNILLRNYCKDNNFTYVLPYNETVFKNSYSQLITLINKLDKDSAIISCSIFMLPENESHVKKVLKLLKYKKTYIYFLYENIFLNSNLDSKKINFERKLAKLNNVFFNDDQFKRYLNILLNKS